MNTKPKKFIKIPSPLIIATGAYYLGPWRKERRIIAVTSGTDEGGKPYRHEKFSAGIPWDKEKAVQKIKKATPKNWKWEACAGTFFFSKVGSKNYYKMDEDTWPLAEVCQKKS